MTTEPIVDIKKARRVDLDWLRVLAVLLLVPFHSALIFISDPNVIMYVKDEINSSFLNHFAGWTHQFHMPVLFYVLIISNLNRWMWLLSILGFGHCCLNKNSNVLKYLSSASYPFYIFHLLLNTVIGFYTIKLPVTVEIKYSMIVVLTTLSTFLVYEFVKRIPVIRFLFATYPAGYKQKSPKTNSRIEKGDKHGLGNDNFGKSVHRNHFY
ncbi:MAG: hypothetical protein ABFD10_00470 [Prolixibacteraceae bacterium]